MNKTDIHLSDWQRILIGTAPVGFLLEVMIRSLFIYAILLFVIRLMGKRLSGQLTLTEMAIMLTFGAIVSVPMQTPDRGLMQGVLLLFLFLGFERGLGLWMTKNKKVEELTQGCASMLVKNGVLQLKELSASNISREQLFALLRNRSVHQLGKVKRLYQEASGNFSLYENPQPAPGLSVLPKQDEPVHRLLRIAKGMQVCSICGNIRLQQAQVCEVCGNSNWTNAVEGN